ERAVEDLGQIPGRDHVAQQRLGVLQPIVGLLSDRELQGEALRRQRRHLRARFGSPDLRRRKFAGELPGVLWRFVSPYLRRRKFLGGRRALVREGLHQRQQLRAREAPRQQEL